MTGPHYSSLLTDGADDEPSSCFIELGANRLARDLFLLTAVFALFLVIFMNQITRVTASASWSREGRVVEKEEHVGQGLILGVHLRKDGRIRVGEQLTDTPDQAAAAVQVLMSQKPELRNARVLLNTWRDTPSARTSDVVNALSATGLDPKRFHLRFTEE